MLQSLWGMKDNTVLFGVPQEIWVQGLVHILHKAFYFGRCIRYAG